MAVALRFFATVLSLCAGNVQSLASGTPEVPKIDGSLVLLTQDQKNKTYLADPSEYLKKPRHVLNKMNHHVGELESLLTDAQQQHTAEVSKQKATLEEKLSQQAEENHRLKQENLALETDINKLQESKQVKHDIAKDLVNQNSGLRTSLQSLLSNISYAQEFTEGALNDAARKLRGNASELQVLRDLEAQDAAHRIELEHARSLKAVADPSKISMLEVGTQIKRKQHPEDLLQMLANTLNDLTKEQNASVVSLQEQFDIKFRQGEMRRQALLDKQSELNATKIQETELNQRLADTIEYLRTVREKLLANIHSVQGFISTVGHKALPRKEEPQVTVAKKAEPSKPKKQNKTKKEHKHHKHEKAVLVQVNPKVASSKSAAKGHKEASHSMTRGHQKLLEEHAKEHKQGKAALAKASANPGPKTQADRATPSAEQAQNAEESNTASSWLSWLHGVVGRARQALS